MNVPYEQELLSEQGSYLPIEDHSAVGNLRTVGLVGAFVPRLVLPAGTRLPQPWR